MEKKNRWPVKMPAVATKGLDLVIMIDVTGSMVQSLNPCLHLEMYLHLSPLLESRDT